MSRRNPLWLRTLVYLDPNVPHLSLTCRSGHLLLECGDLSETVRDVPLRHDGVAPVVIAPGFREGCSHPTSSA